MKDQKRKTGVPRLLEIAGTKKWLVIAACALGAIATFLQFSPAVLVYGGVMELVRCAGDLSAVNGPYMRRLALSMLLCFGGFAVLLYVSAIISHIAAFNILYELRMKLAEKLSRLGLGYFTGSGSGAIKQVMSGDVEQIEGGICKRHAGAENFQPDRPGHDPVHQRHQSPRRTLVRTWGASYAGPYAGFVTVIGSPLAFILPLRVILGFSRPI
jgi:ABC-type multidrug transport system fused ATPase/permease subunit